MPQHDLRRQCGNFARTESWYLFSRDVRFERNRRFHGRNADKHSLQVIKDENIQAIICLAQDYACKLPSIATGVLNCASQVVSTADSSYTSNGRHNGRKGIIPTIIYSWVCVKYFPVALSVALKLSISSCMTCVKYPCVQIFLVLAPSASNTQHLKTMGARQSTEEEEDGNGKVFDTAQIYFDADGNLRGCFARHATR